VTLLSFSLQMSSFGIICDPIKPFNYVFFFQNGFYWGGARIMLMLT
jgi:hypothetical protein